MKSFANWMTVVFMVMFWGLRVIIAYMAGAEKSFILQPIDLTVEIVILFITLVCIALVIKRKKIGGIIYLISYIGYFGTDLFKVLTPVLKGEPFNASMGLNAFVSILGVILSIVVMMDLLADNVKKKEDKDTDWFYANKEFDRNLDDRDDKNNYRIL